MNLEKIFNYLKIKFPSNPLENYGSLIWFQYSCSEDIINFEITDWTSIDAVSEKTGKSYKKEVLDIILSSDTTTPKYQVPAFIIETLISNLFDSAGFVESSDLFTPLHHEKICKMDAFYSELRKMITNPERKILIVSFGVKFKSPISMEQNFISEILHLKCEKTFDARHIHSSKPKGGGLHDLRGTDEIIQKTIESGTGFEFVMSCIVKSIEKENYKTIGIYCTAGHHRSVALVELLKKYLYPNAEIKHLHINR